jgi:hypothetical protein
VERSDDVRAAVLLDPAGGLVAAAGVSDRQAERSLAGLAHELVLAADSAAAEPIEQIEAQTGEGAAFVARDAHHVLACVTRRLALPSLVLYDLRQTLRSLGGPA